MDMSYQTAYCHSDSLRSTREMDRKGREESNFLRARLKVSALPSPDLVQETKYGEGRCVILAV